jgi:hypothetical protein
MKQGTRLNVYFILFASAKTELPFAITHPASKSFRDFELL